MKQFKYDYDANNDDLFVYLEESQSSGSVEIGDLIIDLDKNGNLVAMEILEASKFFKKIISEFIEIEKIKLFEVEIVDFRNMEALKLRIITDNQTFSNTLLIPRITTSSPSLYN